MEGKEAGWTGPPEFSPVLMAKDREGGVLEERGKKKTTRVF